MAVKLASDGWSRVAIHHCLVRAVWGSTIATSPVFATIQAHRVLQAAPKARKAISSRPVSMD